MVRQPDNCRDILKTGLVAVSIISSFSLFIYVVVDDVIVWATEHKTWKAMIGVFVFWCISLTIALYNTHTNPEPHYGLVISVHMSLLAVANLTFISIDVVKKYPTNVTARGVIWDVTLAIASVAVFGTAAGHYVRDTKGFEHEVTFVDGETQSLGLVMMTSRHVVFDSKERVLVVPLSDVRRLARLH